MSLIVATAEGQASRVVADSSRLRDGATIHRVHRVFRSVVAVSERHGAAPESVGDFARRCGLDLLRTAYLLCGDRDLAEDLLQEVFVSLYRRFPRGLPMANPLAYARRSLVNANISRSRRAASRELVTDTVPEVAANPSPDPAEQDALWQALRRLPARQRAALILRFYADLSDADIAATLGCRPGTVRSLASRGLSALRADALHDLRPLDGGA